MILVCAKCERKFTSYIYGTEICDVCQIKIAKGKHKDSSEITGTSFIIVPKLLETKVLSKPGIKEYKAECDKEQAEMFELMNQRMAIERRVAEGDLDKDVGKRCVDDICWKIVDLRLKRLR